MATVTGFFAKTLIGSSSYEALAEAGVWCEDLKNSCKTDKNRWKPLCQLAQQETDSANKIFLVTALIFSVIGLLFGSGFILSTLTTGGIMGVLLTLDAKSIITRISAMHQGLDPTFLQQLQKGKTLFARIQTMIQDTLILKRVPIEWLEGSAAFLGLLKG